MRKYRGITSLELLLGLSIASSVTLYTLSMSEEVEQAVSEYQSQTQTVDIKAIRSRMLAGTSVNSNAPSEE